MVRRVLLPLVTLMAVGCAHATPDATGARSTTSQPRRTSTAPTTLAATTTGAPTTTAAPTTTVRAKPDAMEVADRVLAHLVFLPFEPWTPLPPGALSYANGVGRTLNGQSMNLYVVVFPDAATTKAYTDEQQAEVATYAAGSIASTFVCGTIAVTRNGPGDAEDQAWLESTDVDIRRQLTDDGYC
jgi:hypothetical protein